MSAAEGSGYLGYTGGWQTVVPLIGSLEADEPQAGVELRREAHRGGLVTSFDWPTWMTGRGRELTGDPEAIGRATLEECRRLLVAHLRRDRFVEGHLAAVIASGEVVAILRRASTLTAGGPTAPVERPVFDAGPPAAPSAASSDDPRVAATVRSPPPANPTPA